MSYTESGDNPASTSPLEVEKKKVRRNQVLKPLAALGVGMPIGLLAFSSPAAADSTIPRINSLNHGDTSLDDGDPAYGRELGPSPRVSTFYSKAERQPDVKFKGVSVFGITSTRSTDTGFSIFEDGHRPGGNRYVNIRPSERIPENVFRLPDIHRPTDDDEADDGDISRRELEQLWEDVRKRFDLPDIDITPEYKNPPLPEPPPEQPLPYAPA